MRCENCGAGMAAEWRFCPACGFRFAGRKDLFNAVFGNMFTRMNRELREMDRRAEKHMEVLDLAPFFRQPASSGFSIKISRTGSEKPQVSVRTFGNVDRERIEQHVQTRFRMQPVAERGLPQSDRQTTFPAATEEPKAAVIQKKGKALVELELPGVREKDITVTELESSVEIRASAGDKAYFKILTKPQHARLLASRFENGKLTVELSQ